MCHAFQPHTIHGVVCLAQGTPKFQSQTVVSFQETLHHGWRDTCIAVWIWMKASKELDAERGSHPLARKRVEENWPRFFGPCIARMLVALDVIVNEADYSHFHLAPASGSLPPPEGPYRCRSICDELVIRSPQRAQNFVNRGSSSSLISEAIVALRRQKADSLGPLQEECLFHVELGVGESARHLPSICSTKSALCTGALVIDA